MLELTQTKSRTEANNINVISKVKSLLRNIHSNKMLTNEN